jgi:hypothetical protein
VKIISHHYNNDVNCQFPKDGCMYSIPKKDIKIVEDISDKFKDFGQNVFHVENIDKCPMCRDVIKDMIIL